MNARLVLLVACLTAATLRAEPPTDQLVNDGLDAYKAGDYDAAIGKFSEAIAQDPKNQPAYNDRGLAYKEKNDFEHAVADFTKALQLKRDWSTYYNRGTAYWQKGDNDAGIADFTKALELNPKDPRSRADCFLGRAHCYFNKEEDDPAMADLNRAIKLNEREPDAYVLRGILHKVRHDYTKSLADYETAIGLDPLNSRSYEIEAYLLSVCPAPKYRNADKAIAYATKACELTHWKDAPPVETLAAAYAEAGRFDEAIKFQTKAAELDPKAVDAKRLALYQQKQPLRELNRKAAEQPFANLATITDKLIVKMGEKVSAQFETDGDRLLAPKLTSAKTERPNSLWLEFREEKGTRVLYLWHSFPQPMQARCLARLKGYDTYFETDILPVPLKTINRELWHEPIEELVVFDFKLSQGGPVKKR